jgi:hypothetical protein
LLEEDTVPVTENLSSPRDHQLHAWTGSRKLIQEPNTSSSEVKATITAHHAQLATLEEPVELLNRDQESIFTESPAGLNHQDQHHQDHQDHHDHQSSQLDHTPESSLEENTALTTPFKSSTSETTLTVVSGLLRPIKKLDSSSSDQMPTGIAHHAQSHILEDKVDLFGITEEETPSFTESITGLHQTGLDNTRELVTTLIVLVTRSLSSQPDQSKHVPHGLEELIRVPDGSSSDMKETITVHHAQPPIRETGNKEHLTKIQAFTFMKSLAGLHQDQTGKTNTRELLITDIAQVTRNPLSTTETLLHAPTG